MYLLIIFISTITNAQHTDLKEYGLKGHVKSITTVNYESGICTNNQWIPYDEAKPNTITTLYFNKSGIIDSSITEFGAFKTDTSSFRTKTIYVIEQNKKVSAKYYDHSGKFTETIKIKWLNNKTYSTYFYDLNGKLTFESTSWLNDEYRDNKGEYKSYDNDTLNIYEKYDDVFDSDKQLIKANFVDQIGKKEYTILYKHQAFDEFKNPTYTALVNITTGTLKRISIWRIEYY